MNYGIKSPWLSSHGDFYYMKKYMIEKDGFPYSIYMNYKNDKDTQKKYMYS